MIQALNPAFFGKVVPLAGERKPPTKSPITRLLHPHLDRMSDGRYMHRVTMENRCGNTIDVGARRVYVMDEYGDTVLVDDWGHSWY
ncbi:MAG: hypothetical protein WBF95_16585 [Comamonas thiooxydans]